MTYQISPEFNKNTRNYYVAIPTTISSVEVNAQAESAKATVKITGNTQLTKTENTIQIVVTSAKGRKKTYKIIVTKQKENTLKLQSLEIKGATFSPAFDSSKYYYTAEMKINDDSKDITVEAVANNANANITIRIHCDSINDSGKTGATILVPAKNSQYTKNIYCESNKYAEILKKSLQNNNIKVNGVFERNDITGFNWSKVPVIILEMGFMSNYNEDKMLSDPNYQKLLMESVSESIDKYSKGLIN